MAKTADAKEKDIPVSEIEKDSDIPATKAKADVDSGNVKIKALVTIRSSLGAFNKGKTYSVSSDLAKTLIESKRAVKC